jgi:hypothetical protein
MNGIEVRLCNRFNRYAIKETDIKINLSDILHPLFPRIDDLIKLLTIGERYEEILKIFSMIKYTQKSLNS